MIIAVGKREKDQKVVDWNLEDPDKVKVTGFPLFDPLVGAEAKRQILFCPTWRNQLDELDQEEFEKSTYWQEITNFLKDRRLHDYLEDNSLQLVFRCHFRMAHLLQSMEVRLPAFIRVETGSADESLQQCLMDSLLLITDYSSIFWDMAFMRRPVILFQFDRLSFLAERGLHSFSTADEDMPFVLIAQDRDALFKAIEASAQNQFFLSDEQLLATQQFFDFQDGNSSQRVYQEILQLLKKVN